jgi:predicted molibdopterin-dependent oxidoreductase YjgC
MAHTLTTCTFCGVGCGIYLETAGSHVTGAYPSMSHPSNQGRICVRGWNVHEVASSPDRLRSPLLRRNGAFVEVSWDDAIAFLAERLTAIRDRHGPEGLAFLLSPRCSNEESYLLQKFARTLIGTNNVDHGTGVYCNNSIQALLDMLGVPATTNSIGELAHSEAIIVDGVDLARQLPTVGGWVLRAKLNGTKLIVIDSRRHRLAEEADIFLQLKPNTEVFLYGAMAKVIVDRGLMDQSFLKAHCHNYPAFVDAIAQYDLLQAAEVCGLAPDQIEAAARAYATARTAALLYSTGIESRNRDSIHALVNLALLTGNLGKKGAGLFALTEQNNLQGVCDMGMLPDRLPGYLPVTNPAARNQLERAWKVRLPTEPGANANQLLAHRDHGRLRALWLCRYDPVSTAFFGDAGRTLGELDLVVVQHLFMTGTAQHAHVILPVTAFGEEQVTFTSTDRRIQIAEQVIQPLPGPLPAWLQLTRLARAMGADWTYATPAEVMREIGEIVPFYSGASYDNLRREYGRQWPCTRDKPLGTRFLFEDGLPEGGFTFKPVARPAHRPWTAVDHPFVLVFGHSLYYWHQNVLVKHSETLKREYRILLLDYPDGFVEINSDDARQLGIRDGEPIRLATPDGSALSTARVTPEVKAGTIFVPYFLREVERQLLSHGHGNGIDEPVHVRLEKP